MQLAEQLDTRPKCVHVHVEHHAKACYFLMRSCTTRSKHQPSHRSWVHAKPASHMPTALSVSVADHGAGSTNALLTMFTSSGHAEDGLFYQFLSSVQQKAWDGNLIGCCGLAAEPHWCAMEGSLVNLQKSEIPSGLAIYLMQVLVDYGCMLAENEGTKAVQFRWRQRGR